MCIPKLRIRDFYSHFPQVLVQACFAGHKHKMHSDSPKGAFRRWIAQRNDKGTYQLNSMEQSTIGTRSRSSPKPTTRRRWAEAVVKGRPTLGGRWPPLGTFLLLALAMPCLHAKVVELLFHTKNSLQHHLGSYINRGVPLLHNTHNKPKSFITFEQHSTGLGPR